MRPQLTLAAAMAAGLALAGCGGGDGGSGPSLPDPPLPIPYAVPDSAINSTTSFVAYLNGQSFTDETSEALLLPAGDPATSETEEPLPVT